MKLGYMVPEFPSQTHTFFWREIQALRALGVEVQLLSTRRPRGDACRHEFAAQARAQTRYVFPPRWLRTLCLLALHPFKAAQAFAYVWRLNESPPLRRARLFGLVLPAVELMLVAREQGIEHVHVHSCADAAHLLSLCRLLGGPSYSLTLHGDLAVYGTDHFSKMQAARFVICVTTPLQISVCKSVGLPVERVPVLSMGVDTAHFRDEGRRKPIPGRLNVVTVARLNVAKGHVFALEAVRLLVDQGVQITYVIAGEGPERSSIEQRIAALNLDEHVHLLGTRSEEEVLSLLQQADVLLLPSVGAGEAAPVSVMEAMACGLPVVCSRIGGTPDMIQDGTTGYLVAQGDSLGISALLTKLAGNVELRLRIGVAARQHAVRAFDCKVLARRMRSLIQPGAGAP